MAIYVAVPFILLLCFAVLNLFRVKSPFERRPVLTDKDFEFAFIVTAHQEPGFLIPLVDSLMKQTYGRFYAYIVADDCDTESLSFPDPRIIVLKPEPALHSKAKSIHYAMDRFSGNHDAIIILDADSLVHPSFLDVMNKYFQKGYRVVQSDFKPKNTDTQFARMDAIGDMFNFFVDREARMRLGISSSVWGSGVAFDRTLYSDVQYKDFLGGFDKKLQFHLVQQVPQIAFSTEAIQYDEKIVSGSALENQRIRWLNAYFKYFRESFATFLFGVKRVNFNLLYFGFINLRPPLFIVMGMAFVFTVLDYFIYRPFFFAWLAILFSFLFSFVAIIAFKSKDRRYIGTLFMMPLFVFRQFTALLKMKKAKKLFLQTQHTRMVYIDDLVK